MNVSVSCAYTQGKREQFSGFNRTLDAINNVFRKFSAFHDETGRLNVDGMNIISNDGSNKLNRSRKARVSYKVQRTINASLNAATSTRAVRGFAIQRLMNAMRQAHADGWFIVFDTLTLADDRLEAFYDNPNALRDYFRDIGRMVLA